MLEYTILICFIIGAVTHIIIKFVNMGGIESTKILNTINFLFYLIYSFILLFYVSGIKTGIISLVIPLLFATIITFIFHKGKLLAFKSPPIILVLWLTILVINSTIAVESINFKDDRIIKAFFSAIIGFLYLCIALPIIADKKLFGNVKYGKYFKTSFMIFIIFFIFFFSTNLFMNIIIDFYGDAYIRADSFVYRMPSLFYLWILLMVLISAFFKPFKELILFGCMTIVFYIMIFFNHIIMH